MAMYSFFTGIFILSIVIRHFEIITAFSCKGRITGYYADVDMGCQVYHMCDGLGRQFTYTCPNRTLFQQRMLICDHWYMVNCSMAEGDYDANSLIGQREKPFVEDTPEHPYRRTPRPSNITQQEYDIIYRTGRAHSQSVYNIVGANNAEKADESGISRIRYELPTHWSTEHSVRGSSSAFISQKTAARFNTPPPGLFNTYKDLSEKFVNFESNFKATTPVYPKHVDLPFIPSERDVGLLPPVLEVLNHENEFSRDHNEATDVRFKSTYKATTPVYPSRPELPFIPSDRDVGLLPPPRDSHQENNVNFVSDFKATTPVYPNKEEISKIFNESDIELLPPTPNNSFLKDSINENSMNIDFRSDFYETTVKYSQPEEITQIPPLKNKNRLNNFDETKSTFNNNVNFPSNFKATTPVYPKPFELPRGDLSNEASNLLPPKSATENEQNDDGKDKIIINFQSDFKGTTPVYPKAFELPSGDLKNEAINLLPPKSDTDYVDSNLVNVNFQSTYQATTPVYPSAAGLPNKDLSNVPEDLLPPKNDNTESNPIHVNFASNFKATTPVYPKELGLPQKDLSNVAEDLLPPKNEDRHSRLTTVHVNFESDFEATTPVYPKASDLPRKDLTNVADKLLPPKKETPAGSGEESTILPPIAINDGLGVPNSFPTLSTDFLPPKVDLNFSRGNESEEIIPSPPSKFFLPPKFIPDYTEVDDYPPVHNPFLSKNSPLKSSDSSHWTELRKKLFIPDYEFPLDSVARPSYSHGLSSFQVNMSSVVNK